MMLENWDDLRAHPSGFLSAISSTWKSADMRSITSLAASSVAVNRALFGATLVRASPSICDRRPTQSSGRTTGVPRLGAITYDFGVAITGIPRNTHEQSLLSRYYHGHAR